jgi:aminoglycoside adenylyltransferase-like protein
VLTACRILHTLRTGDVVPKMEAARSARSTVDASLAAVIGAAMAWRKHDLQLDATVEGTAALLRLVQRRCAAWERRFDAAGTRVFPTPSRRE